MMAGTGLRFIAIPGPRCEGPGAPSLIVIPGLRVETWGTRLSVESLPSPASPSSPSGIQTVSTVCSPSLDQIALSTVHGLENLDNGRAAHLPTFGGDAPA